VAGPRPEIVIPRRSLRRRVRSFMRDHRTGVIRASLFLVLTVLFLMFIRYVL
jgi:hypothetical protein